MSTTFALLDGDIELDQAGRPILVSGRDKLDQDIAHSLLTPYDPSVPIGNRLVSDVLPDTTGEAFVTREVSEAIQRLTELQADDASVTPDERIRSVEHLQVVPLDALKYAFVLQIRTEDGNTVSQRKALSLEHRRLPNDLRDRLLRGDV